MDSDANTYLVLGATGGIGSELCRRLARARVWQRDRADTDESIK